MKSESEIRKIYERKLRMFTRTGRDTFLYQSEILKEILEISDKEEEQLIAEYEKEMMRCLK